MASINNAVAQFKKKNMGVNGVTGVLAIKEGNEDCIHVAVQNMAKHKDKFPKVFLGYRLLLYEFFSGSAKA